MVGWACSRPLCLLAQPSFPQYFVVCSWVHVTPTHFVVLDVFSYTQSNPTLIFGLESKVNFGYLRRCSFSTYTIYLSVHPSSMGSLNSGLRLGHHDIHGVAPHSVWRIDSALAFHIGFAPCLPPFVAVGVGATGLASSQWEFYSVRTLLDLALARALCMARGLCFLPRVGCTEYGVPRTCRAVVECAFYFILEDLSSDERAIPPPLPVRVG